jgi:hypothetical protein
LHIRFFDGPPVRLLDEIAQQFLSVALRGIRDHFDCHVADRAAWKNKWRTSRWTTHRRTAVRRHCLEPHSALLSLIQPPHRQVAEQQLITLRGMRILQRPRHFQPLHGVAGHALLGRKRIDVLLVGAVDARAEEPHRVGADALAACELHFDLANGRRRREVHCTDGSRLP